MADCLDDNDLQLFFRGQMSASRADSVQRHIDHCSGCRQLVAELARTPSEEEALQPTLQTPTNDPPTPPVVERVVIRDGKLTRKSSPASTTLPAASPKRGLGAGSLVAERYQLERVLGDGGTGVVWEATHTVMRRKVALKFLKSKDPQAQRRFFREARVTAALRHPHIIEVQDVFVVPETGTPAIVMELLEGAPLSRFTRFEGRPVAVSLQQAARVLLPVVTGLSAAHAVGVVHRDLKPENIFLVGPSPSLDAPRVKVLDFGLAKLTAADGDVMSSGLLTRTGVVVGTPHYMSPEQVAGDRAVDQSTDMWSLGVILYELLAGKRPIEADNLNKLFRAIAAGTIAPIGKVAAKVPKPVAVLVTRLLAHSPEDRPSLEEVHVVLSAHA